MHRLLLHTAAFTEVGGRLPHDKTDVAADVFLFFVFLPGDAAASRLHVFVSISLSVCHVHTGSATVCRLPLCAPQSSSPSLFTPGTGTSSGQSRGARAAGGGERERERERERE